MAGGGGEGAQTGQGSCSMWIGEPAQKAGGGNRTWHGARKRKVHCTSSHRLLTQSCLSPQWPESIRLVSVAPGLTICSEVRPLVQWKTGIHRPSWTDTAGKHCLAKLSPTAPHARHTLHSTAANTGQSRDTGLFWVFEFRLSIFHTKLHSIEEVRKKFRIGWKFDHTQNWQFRCRCQWNRRSFSQIAKNEKVAACGIFVSRQSQLKRTGLNFDSSATKTSRMPHYKVHSICCSPQKVSSWKCSCSRCPRCHAKTTPKVQLYK